VQTASKEEFCSAQNPNHKNLLKFVQMHKSLGFRDLGFSTDKLRNALSGTCKRKGFK
jgi:hypothetical protein